MNMVSRGSRMLALALERAAVLSENRKSQRDTVWEKREETFGDPKNTPSENVDLEFDVPSGSGIANEDHPFNLSSSELPIWEDSDDSIKDPDYELSSSDDESVKHWGKVLEHSVEKVCKDTEVMTYVSPEYVNNVDTNETHSTQENENIAAPSNNKIKGIKKFRQEQRNRGLPYKTKKEKNIQAKKLTPLSSCRNNCCEKISLQNQRLLFENYWALGSYNKRVLYISSLIRIKEKSLSKTKKCGVKHKNRQFTSEYTIEVSGKSILVCKRCFLGCFGESNGFVRSVLSKKLNSPSTTLVDKRGCLKPPNALSLAQKDEIKAHIQKFPAYESHYTRSDTSKKYLQPGLTISKMYSLYCLETEEPKSLSSYTKVFHELNLKIKSPQLDTCGVCDKLHHKISAVEIPEEKLRLEDELARHQEKADFAYACKRTDKNLEKTDKIVAAYAFDLQQCLPTPFLKSNIAFYKRQLWTYNLTVHNLATDQPHCYMWHEGLAKRGGNEIAGCIFKHIDEEVPVVVKNLIFYSDSCPGQNKNSHVSCMFIAALANSEQLEVIDHKFLEPGHTHNECDADHSIIERKKKNTSAKIHHPRDWLNLISTIRDRNPFKVKEMQRPDFLDFAVTSKDKFTWRKVNTDGEKYSWRDFRWLRYKKNEFGSLFYKNSLNMDEPFKTINLKKRGGNTINKSDIKMIQHVPPISKEKAQDLLFLLDFVDPQFHAFYRSLVVDTITNCENIHPDVYDSDEDNAYE